MKTLKEIAIILTGIVITTLVLERFSDFIAHLLDVDYDWKFELAMVTGQMIFQALFILKRGVREIIAYTSRLLLVSLVGSLLLLPAIAWNCIYVHHDLVNLGWFFSVAVVMFFLHKQYIDELRWPWYLCYTWVLYRLIILIFIL
jgi:hypothetical protein